MMMRAKMKVRRGFAPSERRQALALEVEEKSLGPALRAVVCQEVDGLATSGRGTVRTTASAGV